MSIFLTLFFTFLKIGIFNFGGGYAMIALIQSEVVFKHAWLTATEFTDIVAISQITPGPLGINIATYAGYTAVVNAGYGTGMGIFGALLASFSVILLPLAAMLIVIHLFFKYKDQPRIAAAFSMVRIAVIGLLAAATLLLLSPENFGHPGTNPWQFILSCLLFVGVFVGSYHFKKSPILLLCICGILGILFFY